MNKFFLFPFSFLLCASMLASCDDFFEPETADALSGEKYMSSLTEMSTGYLGILTKMQAVGDKEIYLTDTRGEMLEPTEQSIAELIALYNYENDLTGNSYADPAPYYDVVIACNDYIHKMKQFNENYSEQVRETEYFDGLLASAVRVKAWAYMTMAEIYGQALWFDDPIYSIIDVNNRDVFTLMNTEQIVSKCISMLESPIVTGSKSIDASTKFSWIGWLDSEHVNNIANSSYRYWDMMTPDYEPLMARLQLWKGAFLEKNNGFGAGAKAYEEVLSQLLPYLQSYFAQFSHYWKRCPNTPGHYSAFWNNATPYQEEVVSAIIYDYTKKQTNKLLYHFSDEYPNKFLLQSCDSARARFYNKKFSPMSTIEVDPRLDRVTKERGGKWCIIKYRPDNKVRVNAYQDDVHIYTFRVSELFLWLAESLNHLGRYEAMDRIVNNGFSAADYDMLTNLQNGADSLVTAEQLKEFKGFNSYWAIPAGTDKYGTYTGFRGCLGLDGQKFVRPASDNVADSIDAQRINDELIANEWMLDFPCEGKVYPNLVRVAERYNDPNIVASRVTPKYAGRASEIATKINTINPITGTMGYYVPWNLGVK